MIAPTMATKAVESNNLVIASSWQPVDFRGYVSEINAFSNSIATTTCTYITIFIRDGRCYAI